VLNLSVGEYVLGSGQIRRPPAWKWSPSHRPLPGRPSSMIGTLDRKIRDRIPAPVPEGPKQGSPSRPGAL